MSVATATATPRAAVDAPVRKIALRTRGNSTGRIKSALLMEPTVERGPPNTPSELAEMLKPFILLDAFDMAHAEFAAFGLHPHSGMATLTYITGGEMNYEDSSGHSGVLKAGDVEWLHASQGAFHAGAVGEQGCQLFQLWIALPADQETGDAKSTYLPKEQVPKVGPVTVLLGAYQGVSSPLTAPSDIAYLGVSLKVGQRWRYEPAATHTVAWMATKFGSVRVPELVQGQELVAFEPSNQAIEFEAVSDVEFVVGSAVKHPYTLSIYGESSHTSPEALEKGKARIAEIKARLIAEGRLVMTDKL
jgi:redox-sensitive bicupin YhaK (pirin superfamily)